MVQLEKLHLEMLNRLAPSSFGNAEKVQNLHTRCIRIYEYIKLNT